MQYRNSGVNNYQFKASHICPDNDFLSFEMLLLNRRQKIIGYLGKRLQKIIGYLTDNEQLGNIHIFPSNFFSSNNNNYLEKRHIPLVRHYIWLNYSLCVFEQPIIACLYENSH